MIEQFAPWFALIGGPPAFYHAFKFVRGWHRRGSTFVTAINVGLGQIEVLNARHEVNSGRLFKIEQQLESNGGKSLRDAINRIDPKVNRTLATHTAIINVLDHPMFFTDSNGELVYTNRSFQWLIGYSKADLIGRGWLTAVKESDRDRVADGWFRAVKDKRIFSTEMTFCYGASGDERKEGHEIRVRLSADPMRDDTGDVAGWLGAVEMREARTMN
ncbi:MAG TPA: PAS domain S-box protein [Vicinamibacterales bacterium]|nr:PAS domain S-box protein [Vicinamibacterales bacterium]